MCLLVLLLKSLNFTDDLIKPVTRFIILRYNGKCYQVLRVFGQCSGLYVSSEKRFTRVLSKHFSSRRHNRLVLAVGDRMLENEIKRS